MKTLLIAAILTATMATQAQDACFTFDDGIPEHLTLYKVKVMKVKAGQSVRLSGVAVTPNAPEGSPMSVEGSALGLTYGHINYYLTAISQTGNAASAPISMRYANQPSYAGTPSPNMVQVLCDDFPELANF